MEEQKKNPYYQMYEEAQNIVNAYERAFIEFPAEMREIIDAAGINADEKLQVINNIRKHMLDDISYLSNRKIYIKRI